MRHSLAPSVQLATLLFLLFGFATIVNAQPQKEQKQWHWFSAISLQDDWSVLKGSADVIIKKDIIHAELYDEKGGLRISIDGTIRNNQIKAKAIREGTDDTPRQLSGTINKFKWGRCSILLIDKYAGGLVIGLTVD